MSCGSAGCGKELTLGKAGALPGCARLCFQHANHQLCSLGAKGFSPLQGLRVFLPFLGDPLKRENPGQNKVRLFEGVSLFGKEGPVFVELNLENNHSLNTFYFASWMHILSWKLLFNDMLAFSCLIYSSSFLPLPCSFFVMKQNYFFLYKPLKQFSLFFVNVLLVRGGKKTPEISKFSWIPVHRFILRAGRHNKRKFVYYNFFPLTFALVQLQHSPSFWHYFLCPLNTFALCFWPSFHWLHPWVDRSLF